MLLEITSTTYPLISLIPWNTFEFLYQKVRYKTFGAQSHEDFLVFLHCSVIIFAYFPLKQKAFFKHVYDKKLKSQPGC